MGRNYILENMKGPGKPDVTEVIVGDFNVGELYSDIWPPERIERELRRDTRAVVDSIDKLAAGGDWQGVQGLFDLLVEQYGGHLPMYFDVAEILSREGQAKAAAGVLSVLLSRTDMPEATRHQAERMLTEIEDGSMA